MINHKGMKVEVEHSTFVKLKRHKRQRIIFNLSFLTSETGYNFATKSQKLVTNKFKKKFLERLCALSEEDIITLLGENKVKALENIPESEVSLRINKEFESSGRYDECSEGFWIFRLSKQGRVIGKMNNNLYYVLKLDPNFSSYEH